MATKRKTTTKEKTKAKAKVKAAERNEFDVDPAFPVKFMEDVAFVAYETLFEHLKKIDVPEEVVRFVDAICGVYENIVWIEKHNGKTSHASNEFLAEFVADCVRYTTKFGGKIEIVVP